MKLKTALICMAGVCSCFAEDAVKPLGTMDGFYRYTAVLGQMLVDGHRLRTMPEWMFETDFPYMDKRNPVVPFADGLTVVRLLGGWEDKTLPDDRRNDPNDLVFRDEAGKLQVRRNLLKERLDPFVTNGYTNLTLVLDNVPWCLAETPKKGNLGQVAPPGDYNEWYVFIRDLCRELKNLYGEKTVSNFRFRVGTEMQDHRRFAGSQEEYLKLYDFAAKAVEEEIPLAGFGPFNRSMPWSETEKKKLSYDLVDILDVAEHCASGTNYATGQIGAPMDFLARSFYYFSSQPRPGIFENIHPDQRTPEIGNLWREARAILPGLSREVQEFGPHLSTEEGLYGLDTGARGAAQTFHTLVNLKEEGADRIWHWELFEDISDDQALLLSQGWLYSVLDPMRGGQMYSVPVSTSSDHGNTQKALLSVQKDRAVLVVANWNVDRVKHEPDHLSVLIPRAVMNGRPSAVQSLCLSETNSVYDVIRNDLKTAGLLSKQHLEHRGEPATLAVTGGYNFMASNRTAGRQFISKHWEKYQQLMRNALTLSDFAGQMKVSAKSITLSFDAVVPSVAVVVINF